MFRSRGSREPSNRAPTRALHEAVAFDTVRPCFVAGPYTSPFSTATAFDNLVLVASGIGITPALRIVEFAKATRRCNLMWMTRDASMVEFYLSSVTFDDDAYAEPRRPLPSRI